MSDSLDRLRAALADRYSLERQLGQGGKGAISYTPARAVGCSPSPSTSTASS
jgi:hypothetical protein